MKLVAIYCRVSSKEQTENNSLSYQEKFCRQYCDREKFEVDRVFIEKGESAKTANRTELQKLLVYCQQNQKRLYAVVFNDATRFSRELLDYLMLKKQLKAMGIQLKTPSLNLDDSPESYFREMIEVLLGDTDNKKKAILTRSRMKETAISGQWNHKPPLGYISGLNPLGKKTILPDEKYVHFIQEAFKLYSTGQNTQKEVLDILSAKGFREKNGKKVSAQHFAKILRNPIYTGKIVEKKWDIESKGSFKALISLEIFEKVQGFLSGKTLSFTPYLRNNPDFPLRYFTKCGTCENPLTACWATGKLKKRYAYYHCRNKVCPVYGKSIRGEVLEKLFFEHLQSVKPKAEKLREICAKVASVWKQKQASFIQASKAIEAKIEAIKSKKRKYADARVEKTIDQQTYEDGIAPLDKEIALAEIESSEISQEDLDVQEILNFVEYVLNRIETLWLAIPSEAKQRLQKVLFPEGVHFKDGKFRTPETPIFVKLLEAFKDEKSTLVAPRGIEPRFNG